MSILFFLPVAVLGAEFVSKRQFTGCITKRQLDNHTFLVDCDYEMQGMEPNAVYEPDALGAYEWGYDRVFGKEDGVELVDPEAGRDTIYYSVDSGVHAPSVRGVERGLNFASETALYRAMGGDGGGNVDCSGHGTHVASVVARITPAAVIFPVRVLPCSGENGWFSWVYEGLEAVLAHSKTHNMSSVAGISLGGPRSAMLNAKIQELLDADIVVVVSAGNEDIDACSRSPASSEAVAVCATTPFDTKAYFSNHGPCIDVCAPGGAILGASPWPPFETVKSGTSMAQPFHAASCLIIRSARPDLGAREVGAESLRTARAGQLKSLPVNTANKLTSVGTHNRKCRRCRRKKCNRRCKRRKCREKCKRKCA